ncbi:MAG: hypothetical protein IPM34_00165 [Saprospiraceae bacterium]|nr:hypothetical protein [Saprospiraceae bacterium]
MEKDTGSNPVLQKRGTISEKYKFDGVLFVLYFNDNDTSSAPNNTSTADSLGAAIGDTEYNLAYYSDDPDVAYIEPVPNWNESDTTPEEITPVSCMFAEFYEHSNYGGSSFCVDSYFDDHADILEYGVLCGEGYGEGNLQNRPYGLADNWNDKISSLKMFGGGASKAWYDSKGYTGNGTTVTFYLFRDSGYPTSGCKCKKWTKHLPPPGYSANDWDVPNLKKERWGFLCADLNDRVSSIAMIGCKCAVQEACELILP